MHTFRCRELLIFDSLQLSPSFIRPSEKSPGSFNGSDLHGFGLFWDVLWGSGGPVRVCMSRLRPT